MKLKQKMFIVATIATLFTFSNTNAKVINANEPNDKSMVYLKELSNKKSFEAYSTKNIDNSNKIKQSSSKISISNLKISEQGKIQANLKLDKNINIKLDGKFSKEDSKNTYYGEIKTNNKNYEVLHFSITRPGNKRTISKEYSQKPVLNIYLKDIKRDCVNFYEIDIDNDVLNKLDKINSNLDIASIESIYWFINTIEPEAIMDASEEPSKDRAKTLKTVTLNPTLKWSYTDMGKTFNIVSKFTIPTKITQSGDTVISEFKISKHTLTENGTVIKSRMQKIKSLKVMIGSNTKILYLNKVGVNGTYTKSQSPIYFDCSASKQIAPGVSIGVRPLYTSKGYKNTDLVPVNKYQLAFEATKKNSTLSSTRLELSEPGHYLTTSVLLDNPYVGKNISVQYSFRFENGAYGKTFTYNGSNMHTTLLSGTK